MLIVLCVWHALVFFLFKQKTAYEMRISDWSSDVCSSDLNRTHHAGGRLAFGNPRCRKDAGAVRPSNEIGDRFFGDDASLPVEVHHLPCDAFEYLRGSKSPVSPTARCGNSSDKNRGEA